MRSVSRAAVFAIALVVFSGFTAVASAQNDDENKEIQLGPRPYYLIDGMDEGELKNKLAACKDMTFKPTLFSIGHRGGALQFPEHTK
ncbi:MAG TPA: glycerophosphodiester phosphodiesterase, partial [Thermoanaerobaculia bacterium]|nr:glycerophosphodiester phosphodiesterase [Thermoanaerobaculia bacterium]